ncbi:hypothetical protein J2T02_004255 [Chitinophaga terrae (ex Kim and Jung 2007)]|jgi:hypothetical protein|nr:hypothetical protein [Chitinophaga terrae (ex Kim and Jung 2007)]
MCQKGNFLHQKGNFTITVLLSMEQLITFSTDLADKLEYCSPQL